MATGEVDLTGLDEQIRKTDNSMRKLADDTALWGENFAKMNFQKMGTDVSALTRNLSSLADKLSAGEGIKGGVRAIEEYTKAMQTLLNVSSSMQDVKLGGGFDTSKIEQGLRNAAKEAEGFYQRVVRVSQVKMGEISSFSNQQKVNDAKRAELKIQEEINRLIQQGNAKGVNTLLAMGRSVSNLQTIISGLRIAQSNINQSTAEGKKRYEELGAAIRLAERELERMQGRSRTLSSLFTNLKGVASQIALSFGIMTGVFGAANFFRQLYSITSNFQLQQKALSAIVDNAREANILFKQMQSLAVESPIKLMDLNKYAKQLAAFRIETTELYGSLKMLADISVGVGVDMDRLILAFGQVKAANYLRGQELRQFSEAGVNILGGLREYYEDTKGIKLSLNDIFDMVSKRKVLFEDVEAVLKRMTQQGGAFYNMQLIQSQTLYGQVQKLADMFQIEMNKMGSYSSGMLMNFVKIVQFVIKNLQQVVILLTTIAATRGIAKLVQQFGTLVTVSGKFMFQLKGAGVTLYNIIQMLKSKDIAGSFRTLLTSANGLKIAATAVGAAIGIAVSIWTKHRQKVKQQMEDTRLEIEEMNRRLVDTRKIESDFAKKTSYDEKLAAFQELVEKAKEYNMELQVASNITPSNIDENFKEASRQLEKYVKDVQAYRSILQDTIGSRATKKLSELNAPFAEAEYNAETLFNYYNNNIEKLTEKEKEVLNQLNEMRATQARSEEELIETYGMNNEEFEKYFVKRVALIRSLFSTKNTSGYAGEYFYGGEFGTQLKNLDSFLNDYDKRLEKFRDKLNKDLKSKGIDIAAWARLDENKLKENIKRIVPVIIASMEEEGDFTKSEIPNVLGDILGGDQYREIITDVLFNLKNGTTNLDDTSFQRAVKELFGEEPITKEANIFIKPIQEGKVTTSKDSENPFLPSFMNKEKQFVYTDDEGKLVVDYTNVQFKGQDQFITQAKIQSKEIQDIVNKNGADWKESHKELDNLFKKTREEYKRYASAKTIQQVTNINRELGYQFKNQAQALSYLNTQLKELNFIYTGFVWDIPKESGSHSRSQSMKSEYQSMIDFIKKLNTEYDKLRKDFNETTDKYWEGSFERIVKSYEGEFGQMPAKFKDVFKEISKIDFTTKEGTIAGEKLVKGIIKGAKNITEKEKKELLLTVEKAIGDISLQIDLDLKKDADDRLKAHVQKMFDDYNLTVELKKLGIEGFEAADLFGINETTLSKLQHNLEDLKERFIGQNMEKEYQKFMDKIVEINGKANLEMSKKYVKYLREEYDEIAKLQIEYMQKRAEVYALPFDEARQSSILANLQKEMDKKMRKLEWDEFKKSDFYIEMFNDLKNVSASSLEIMNEHLRKMKENMKDLSPTELKAINDEMRKIEEEWIRRNPFDGLIEGFKEMKKLRNNEQLHFDIESLLGAGFDEKSFGARLDAAISVAQSKILDLNNTISRQSTLKKSAETRDSMLRMLGYDRTTLDEIETYLRSYEKKKSSLEKTINEYKSILTPTKEQENALAEYNKQAVTLQSTIDTLSSLKSALEELGDFGSADAEELAKQLNISKEELQGYIEILNRLKNADDKIDEHKKKIQGAANEIKNMIDGGKSLFDVISSSLDVLGVETNEATDAWVDFGNAVFDTMSTLAELMPDIIESFENMGESIGDAAEGIAESKDWIGLVVSIVNVLIKTAKAIISTKDVNITDRIEYVEEALKSLQKQAEKTEQAFNNAFNEDKLMIFNNSIISNYLAQINKLTEKINLENGRKKSDIDKINQWADEIEELNDKINKQNEALVESMGGFGSASNMKSQAEEFASAWYDAFKDTGDGLSALEDSFESFLDNIFKKQIMNRLSEKYFGDLFEQLDTLFVKEGGITGNMDEFRRWIEAMRMSFEGYSEEAEQIATSLFGVAGLGGSLDGLSANIKGMTEETANAFVAYLNSIRFYVSEQNSLIEGLRDSITLDGSNNPMLNQMRLVARNTSAIQALFESVVAPNATSLNGACIKVAMV